MLAIGLETLTVKSHRTLARIIPFLLVMLLVVRPLAAEDLVELASGATVRGTVVSRTATEITIKVVIGNRTYTRTYPLDRVKAVTVNGKREVLGRQAPSGSPKAKGPNPSGPGVTRSRAEVEALIAEVGRTPPDWFDETPLNYPDTLDLNWPHPPPGPWNNKKNVGQFVWDIINPNPGRWREGVKLLHHILSVNKSRDVQKRAMEALGRMYYNLHADYARAAFWWRQAGVDEANAVGPAVHLAECYWRLGNRAMAVELLNKARPTFDMIKLWADMGEVEKALRMADATARAGISPELAYLYAGDACRVAGDFRKALAYYEKALAVPAEGQHKERIERTQNRARASAEAIKLFELSDVSRVPDGSYSASSLGYEGLIAVEVKVQNHRIEAVRITEHKEKQFYSALTDTPAKILQKQSVKGVDATSGATITSEAIINATAKALAGAVRESE